MAGGLGPVAAGGHVAPAPAPGPRGVVEEPAAGVAAAHGGCAPAGRTVSSRTIGSASRARASSIGSPTWRWSTATQPSARRHELDDLAGVERPVDRLERAGCGGRCSTTAWATSRSAARTAWTRSSVARAGRGSAAACVGQPIGALAVDDLAVDEPVEGRVEGRQLLDRETVVGVVGVQEVEGVVERHVVGVTRGRPGWWRCRIVDNHSKTLDRLRARGYSSERNRYDTQERLSHRRETDMEAIVMILVLIVGLAALDVAPRFAGGSTRGRR